MIRGESLRFIGEIWRMSLAAAEVKQPVVVEKASSLNTHEMPLSLAPDQGREIKVTMPKGATVDYV